MMKELNNIKPDESSTECIMEMGEKLGLLCWHLHILAEHLHGRCLKISKLKVGSKLKISKLKVIQELKIYYLL